MNPNFTKEQITAEFTKLVKTNPKKETLLKYRSKIYSQISSSPDSLKFDTKLSLGFYKLRECFSLAAFVFPYFLLSIFEGKLLSPNSEHFNLAISSGILPLLFVWFGFAEKCYYYRLDKKHISTYEHQDQPLIIFSILRYIAWFGVGICIIAVLWIGPMAFVGAGGSALLAFKLINAKREEVYWLINYDGILFIEEVEKENKINITHKFQTFTSKTTPKMIKEEIFIDTIWCGNQDRNIIMQHIKNNIDENVEIFSTDKEENEINFFEKIKDYNLTLKEYSIDEY
ncbi:hypothetical protein [Vibrio intestinalis]|uniref:hypothetical protein n=1 Tax=Vibrio intestinalis TaxID=2933291 RepID=UPI0021A49975|nr:hypothetical protein [Vibrio intestinalis]